MKVGIVTIFATPNYGAMLQAYALSSYLLGRGVDAEVIDYRQPAIEEMFRLRFEFPPRVNHWLRLSRCSRFVQKRIKLGPRTVRTVDAFLPSVHDYDVLITGSDQVWFTGPVQFYDPMYFLDFDAPRSRKVSYAASVGATTSFGEFEGQVRHALSSFDYIGVRDQHTASLVSTVTEKPLVRTPDPVFLHDFTEVIRNEPPSREPYILVFGEFSGDMLRVVNAASKVYGIKNVISLQYRCDSATRRVPAPDPVEWLNWFCHASFVVTSYFHGTVAAVKFNRPFVAIPTPGRRLKIRTLLEPLGLDERCFTTDEELDHLDQVIAKGVDWRRVQDEIAKQVVCAERFVSTAVTISS